MPKLKTKKGMRKRFKLTKRGKVKSRRAGKSHLLTSKSRKRKRKLRLGNLVGGSEAKTIKRFL